MEPQTISHMKHNCVHLRGCSKPFMGTENDDTNYNIKMTKTYNTECIPNISAQRLFGNRAKRQGDPDVHHHEIENRGGMAKTIQDRNIEQSCELFEKSGIHMISRENARARGLRKETMMETIRDFNIIMNAKNIINDGVSLFSIMAAKRLQISS